MASNENSPFRSPLIGVLLAAGRGRRLRGAKQFHQVATPQESRPLVCAAFDTIAPACHEMVVVLGHRANEVAQLLVPRSFQRVDADADAAMIHSVLAGIARARQLNSHASVLLQPGDHPHLASATLTALIAAAAEHPHLAIVPEFAGRGGHPVLLPPRVLDALSVERCVGGLRTFWEQNPQQCLRLPVDDPWVVRDIDTPAAARTYGLLASKSLFGSLRETSTTNSPDR